MEAFAAADLDTDGLLDREEARKLAQSLGVSDDADLPLAIAGMGDRISQSEFVEWYKSQHSSNIQNLAKTLSPTHLLAGAKEVVSIEEMDDRDVRKLAILAAQKQKQKVSRLFGKLSPRGKSSKKVAKDNAAAAESQAPAGAFGGMTLQVSDDDEDDDIDI